MVTSKDVQQRLKDLNVYDGKIDGDFGPESSAATMTALAGVKVFPKAPAAVVNAGVGHGGPVPETWLSPVKMTGIVLHWTAGQNKASSHDVGFYHILIEDDGKLVRGTHTIADNVNTADGDYAAHTLNHNTGIIGVSLCGMGDAIESPFKAGKWPLTEAQWKMGMAVLAQLCKFYNIVPDDKHVMTHAEVSHNLGIPQRGKWDITRLTFDPTTVGAAAVGAKMRNEVKKGMEA